MRPYITGAIIGAIITAIIFYYTTCNNAVQPSVSKQIQAIHDTVQAAQDAYNPYQDSLEKANKLLIQRNVATISDLKAAQANNRRLAAQLHRPIAPDSLSQGAANDYQPCPDVTELAAGAAISDSLCNVVVAGKDSIIQNQGLQLSNKDTLITALRKGYEESLSLNKQQGAKVKRLKFGGWLLKGLGAVLGVLLIVKK